MAAHPRVQVIARRGVGYEQIDVPAAAALGRVVTIAAGGNGPSVADHTIGMILAVSKQLVLLTEQMRRGDWTYRTGFELHEKTVGIIGLGRIGRLVSDRPPDQEFAAAHGVTLTDLPTLLRDSDVVTIHAPLTPLTRNLIDAAGLAAMKPGAILINTARGGIVDESALAASLHAGPLAGAALGVFWATAAATMLVPAILLAPVAAAAPAGALLGRGSLW